IVTPVLEKCGDAAIVMLPTTSIERSRGTNEQSSSGLERSPASRQPGVQVLGVADRLERVDRVEMLVRKFEAVEVGNNDLDATVKFLEFPPANVRLHGGIGHADDFNVAPGRKVVGGSSRSASHAQETHPLPHRFEKGIVRFVGMREDRARKHARAVIVVLAAIGTKHIVVGAVLVVML